MAIKGRFRIKEDSLSWAWMKEILILWILGMTGIHLVSELKAIYNPNKFVYKYSNFKYAEKYIVMFF